MTWNVSFGNLDHRLIEFIDVELDLIRWVREIDFTSPSVDEFDLLALFELDARLTQCRLDLNGRLPVRQSTSSAGECIVVFRRRQWHQYQAD
jgi:hypothetical protein